jgi:hypothetical protein
MPIIFQSGPCIDGSRTTRRLKIGWRPLFLVQKRFVTNSDWSNRAPRGLVGLPNNIGLCPDLYDYRYMGRSLFL